MKKCFVVLFALALIAGTALAEDNKAPELNPANNGDDHSHISEDQVHNAAGFARAGSNLSDHGGPVLVAPKIVFIFWGFGSGTSYTSAIQNFRNTGVKSHIAMLSQYRSAGASAASDLGGSANDKFDTTTPPQNVTDATVQAEVRKFFGGGEDASTIYEVVIPITSYSSSGTSTSCGGPRLAYCAYHGHFTDGSHDVKYSIQPYASCSGCQSTGFSDIQNQNHFLIHESREAISDPDLNAWFDRQGNEADDKCAWTPTPFIDQTTGFAYQYEWSNSAGGCVKQ